MKKNLANALQTLTIFLIALVFIGLGKWQLDRAHQWQEAKAAERQVDSTLYSLATLVSPSATLTNKVYTYVWGKRLYSNIWIVEVADSGICRKTTAMTIGTDILKDVDSTLVLPNELTREKF